MTNAERLLELAERCERAEAGEQRALLTEAFFALHPSPRFEPDWNCAGNEFRQWQDREIAFKRMLDAEAYESAAMTLVPEGHGGSFTFFKDGTAKAFVWQPYPLAIEVRAKTLPLALTAASLRAIAKENDHG